MFPTSTQQQAPPTGPAPVGPPPGFGPGGMMEPFTGYGGGTSFPSMPSPGDPSSPFYGIQSDYRMDFVF